jgi:predicted DNA binding protein
LVAGLIAFAVWLVGALIAWGISRIDTTTTIVTVREGATVTKEGLVYRGGERLTVLIADEERLRESRLIE